MATLVLTAVGTALGGPLGGAIGGLLGNQLDRAIGGSSSREGPRLAELKVTTSSYGTPIARQFGTTRDAGSIIWATDLVESSEETGGGKGTPSATTYSYSISLAVALSSRPIQSVRRIWADGNLLRGEAGDLKVGGELRLYTGRRDQQADPLIASDQSGYCPAFRGIAYAVFENLQLADFGNRVPALTFEVVAENGEVSLAEMIAPLTAPLAVDRPLPLLQGFSDTGGSLAGLLETMDRLYPVACDAAGDTLKLFSGEPDTQPVAMLPPPVVDRSGEGFGGLGGRATRRAANHRRIPSALRYYDVARDYQTGMQRAQGRSRPGRETVIDFPGSLHAPDARALADGAAERAGWGQEKLSYRIAEVDPAIAPGSIVAVDGRPGQWRVDSWEWREAGVELELQRLPQRKPAMVSTDSGQQLPATDILATPTILKAFELPWNGEGSPFERQVFVAASSGEAGWRGATLYAETNGSLAPIGGTGTRRSVVGTTLTALAPDTCQIPDRSSALEVQLAAQDLPLSNATLAALADGANRAMVGAEIIQFAHADNLGEGRWRLTGLLRGRGGTEAIAIQELPAGADFVLLDSRPVAIDVTKLGTSQMIAAIGLADTEPVMATVRSAGRTLKPLTPVHPLMQLLPDGGVALHWIRRSRGAWAWPESVEIPINEQAERYEVGIGDPDRPSVVWESASPSHTLDGPSWAGFLARYPGQPLWVRQIGTHDRSDPLLLATLS